MIHSFPVVLMEVDEGGHTIWIHGPEGATMLRIKTINGKIKIHKNCENTVAHADITTTGDIVFCVPNKK